MGFKKALVCSTQGQLTFDEFYVTLLEVENLLKKLSTSDSVTRFFSTTKLRKQIEELNSSLFTKFQIFAENIAVDQQILEYQHQKQLTTSLLLQQSQTRKKTLQETLQQHFSSVEAEEARVFWQENFSERFMVPWFQFIKFLETYLGYEITEEEKTILQSILDSSQISLVNVYKFSEFLKGFGPLKNCVKNAYSITNAKWFKGYISGDESNRLLSTSPPGTFLIRFSQSSPGSFAMAFVDSTSQVLQTKIMATIASEKYGFTVKETSGERFFDTLNDVIGFYNSFNLLKDPFSMSFVDEAWFYGDLTSEEANQFLFGHPPGTFLIRFSSQCYCYAASYVDESNIIQHVLVREHNSKFEVTADESGQQFNSLVELIQFHGSALKFPLKNQTNNWANPNSLLGSPRRSSAPKLQMTPAPPKPQSPKGYSYSEVPVNHKDQAFSDYKVINLDSKTSKTRWSGGRASSNKESKEKRLSGDDQSKSLMLNNLWSSSGSEKSGRQILPRSVSSGNISDAPKRTIIGSTRKPLADPDTSVANILYSGDGEIKAGTLQQLVDQLYLQETPDYANTFLLTFRSFATSKKLMEMIKEIYVGIPHGEESRVQRLRLINFLKSWVLHHFHDFRGDEELISMYHAFVEEGILQIDGEQISKQLSANMKKQIESDGVVDYKTAIFSVDPPIPMLSKDKPTLCSIEPEELARQITLLEYDLYKAIHPKECTFWTKSNKDVNSPNMLKMVNQFNTFVGWMSLEILKENDFKKRVGVFEHLIRLLTAFRDLNNFNGMMEVISALNSAPVSRLKKTFEAVSNPSKKTLADFSDLLSSNKNFKGFRDILHASTPPLVPYLGLFLTDLTFIEQGNADMVKGLINFKKCTLIAKVIKEVQSYQQSPYNLWPLEVIQDFLRNYKFTTSDDELFELSLIVEPRK